RARKSNSLPIWLSLQRTSSQMHVSSCFLKSENHTTLKHVKASLAKTSLVTLAASHIRGPVHTLTIPNTTIMQVLEHLAQSLMTLTSTILTIPSMIVDRKSTRLNSIHVSTSYAVYCFKKQTPRIPK